MSSYPMTKTVTLPQPNLSCAAIREEPASASTFHGHVTRRLLRAIVVLTFALGIVPGIGMPSALAVPIILTYETAQLYVNPFVTDHRKDMSIQVSLDFVGAGRYEGMFFNGQSLPLGSFNQVTAASSTITDLVQVGGSFISVGGRRTLSTADEPSIIGVSGSSSNIILELDSGSNVIEAYLNWHRNNSNGSGEGIEHSSVASFASDMWFRIDQNDAFFNQNLNNHISPGQAGAWSSSLVVTVPEPSTVYILALALVFIARRRIVNSKNNIDTHKFEIANLAQKPQRLFRKAGGFRLKKKLRGRFPFYSFSCFTGLPSGRYSNARPICFSNFLINLSEPQGNPLSIFRRIIDRS
jgi:hypothetical protein